jgi:hypothetical protein
MNTLIEAVSAAVAPRPEFKVFYSGEIEVRFNRNLCGYVFELAAVGEGTRFGSEVEAAKAATRAGCRHFKVLPVQAADAHTEGAEGTEPA